MSVFMSSVRVKFHLKHQLIVRSRLPEVKNSNRAIGGRGPDFISPGIPADLKDSSGSAVRIDQLSRLNGPDVDTLIKGSRGQESAVRREGNRIHGFRMSGQGVERDSPVHVPQTDS